MIELRWLEVPSDFDAPGFGLPDGNKVVLQYRGWKRVLADVVYGSTQPEPEWVTVGMAGSEPEPAPEPSAVPDMPEAA